MADLIVSNTWQTKIWAESIYNEQENMIFFCFEIIRFIESTENNTRNVQPEQQQKNTLKQLS